MIDACATVDAESLVRDMGTSSGSVLGTLEHMYGADWIWLERWNGRVPAGFPAKGAYGTVDSIRTAWTMLEAERTLFLSTMDGASATMSSAVVTVRPRQRALRSSAATCPGLSGDLNG